MHTSIFSNIYQACSQHKSDVQFFGADATRNTKHENDVFCFERVKADNENEDIMETNPIKKKEQIKMQSETVSGRTVESSTRRCEAERQQLGKRGSIRTEGHASLCWLANSDASDENG